MHAQIPVSAGGSSLQTFDSLPPAGSWSTVLVAGTSAGYSGSNAVAAMDLGVQRFAASNIQETLPTTTLSFGGNLRARWNSAVRCLQTQVDGGIEAVMLMGTLRNVSQHPVLSFNLEFDFAIPVAPGPEDIPGHRLYYNVSGVVSNWVPVRTIASAGRHVIPLNLSNTPWSPGAAMYFLFMDDNAVTNPEGSYQIDNLAVTEVAPGLAITRDPVTATMTLSWRGSGTLQETSTLTTSNVVWSGVPGAQNPYTFLPGGRQRFFTLHP